MNEVHVLECRRRFSHRADPVRELGAIRVRAVAVEHFDVRAQLDFLAENFDDRLLFYNAAAECMLRLESDDENGVPRSRCTMREMVEDASALAHAGAGDDDHRPIP